MTDWNTALPDWEERIVARQSLIPPGLPIYRPRADKALRIFKRLKMVDVPGKPTMGEACDEWVFDFVRAIFGCYDPDMKMQIIREFFLLISKKNGKSSIAAGIMLTALIMNERPAGEYLILAPTKDIADNSFIPAYWMVKEDQALLKRYKPSDTTREIVNRLDGSQLAVKAADAEVIGGQKAISTLIEELWLFGKKAAAANIFSEAIGSQASYDEGFVVFLSTHSDEAPAGIFKTKLQYFRAVRKGEIIDRTSLPVLYEFPDAMLKNEAWRDPANFYVTNPNLGRSVQHHWLVSQFAKKEHEGPEAVRLFVAKHLNVEIGLGYRSDRWAGAEYWERRSDPTLTKEELLARSEVVIPAFDGGGLDDLLGGCLLGRDRETKEWLCWSHAWCHRGVLKRRKSIASRLEDFARAEELTIVDDDPLVDQLFVALRDGDDTRARELRVEIKTRGFPPDIAAVASLCKEVMDLGLLAEVAVDPAGLGLIVDALDEIGITQENGLLVGVSQGYHLMNAIKTAERKLQNGTFWHSPSSCMAWNVANVKIEPTATAIRATKQNAGDAKIDLWAAMIDGVDRMGLNPEAGAIYADGRDLVVL